MQPNPLAIALEFAQEFIETVNRIAAREALTPAQVHRILADALENTFLLEAHSQIQITARPARRT